MHRHHPARTFARERRTVLVARLRLFVTRDKWNCRFSATVLPTGAYLWYKVQDALWWLGKTTARTPTIGHYIVRFLDDRDRSRLPSAPFGIPWLLVCCSWCLQTHLGSAFLLLGIVHRVDDTRGDVEPGAANETPPKCSWFRPHFWIWFKAYFPTFPPPSSSETGQAVVGMWVLFCTTPSP